MITDGTYKMVDTTKDDRIKALIKENEELVEIIEGKKPIKEVKQIINGTNIEAVN